MPIVHLVARTVPWRMSLLDPHIARWLWSKLRRGFPRCHAACLMPRHVHLVADVAEIDAAVERLRRTLAWHARRFGPKTVFQVWQPIPKPSPVHGPAILSRQVRYVALNPCRAGLVDDPLRWYWSTHRDVVGAVTEPWVEAEALAQALDRPHEGFAAAHHTWVSRDETVDPSGTTPPRSAPSSEGPTGSLTGIARAAVLATRAGSPALRRRSLTRRTFIHLARRQGWTATVAIAGACGASPRSVRDELQRPPPEEALRAAALCLGDRRLLHPWHPEEATNSAVEAR